MTNKNILYSGIIVIFVAAIAYIGSQWLWPSKLIIPIMVEKVDAISILPDKIKIDVGNSVVVSTKIPDKIYLECKNGRYVMIEIPTQILIIHPQKYISQRHDGDKYQIFIASKDTGQTEIIEQHYKPVLCRFL